MIKEFLVLVAVAFFRISIRKLNLKLYLSIYFLNCCESGADEKNDV